MQTKTYREPISIRSLGVSIAGALFVPAQSVSAPALIICHGAGEFKENYYSLCEFLADRGIASLAIDMHGHGESGGARFHVRMKEWVADVRAALDFLSQHPQIDKDAIGAFGLSSGGTAILETALIDPRLSFLVPLDATVRNSMPLPLAMLFKGLNLLGKLKERLTGDDLRLPMIKLFSLMKLASDVEINRKIRQNPRAGEALKAFPLPGAAEAFFVDTLTRVSSITAPTLVLWGEDDELDPPKTAHLLFRALTCEKAIQVIPGNGHVGHLDRNREQVFALTADWVLQNIPSQSEHSARAVS
ncbi:MAG: lysophospholipase [Verrucomicrobiales bacterium]|nr:lysophospholipase [Verrucomicrobiales bacterium]